MRQQTFHCRGVLCRARLNAEDVLFAFPIHTHCTEDVVRCKALAVNVDHQNLHALPASFL